MKCIAVALGAIHGRNLRYIFCRSATNICPGFFIILESASNAGNIPDYRFFRPPSRHPACLHMAADEIKRSVGS
jgi:hypothetical protein